MKIKKCLELLVLFTAVPLLFSKETSFPGLFYYRLENGLELFVVENSAAPLAYVHIAAKTGAVSQTPENAGLFHLYEHMLFKGNAKYANEVECTKAVNKMGAIDDNAYTSIDIVNYFFTIPSAQVKNGLEFWSLAVRTPKFDEEELKNEIAVVLSEINGNFSDPAHIRYAAMMKELYPSCPWRLDSGGNPEVVKNASPEQMRKIQREFYVPENSAVFVGGDVHHEEVYDYVKEIFGDWKNAETAVPAVIPSTKEPFSSIQKRVFVHVGNSDGIIQTGYYLRGPDGETDIGDTYAADVWTNIVQNPDSFLVKSLVENPKIAVPSSDYAGGFYSTGRANGMIGFYTAMMNKTDFSPVSQADEVLASLNNEIIPSMTEKSVFFKEDTLKKIIQYLEDDRIYSLETAQSVIKSLCAFWSSCGSDYFFNYDANIAAVTEDDVVSFVKKYILKKNGLFLVTVSPSVWNKYRADFEKAGYKELKTEDAFWY